MGALCSEATSGSIALAQGSLEDKLVGNTGSPGLPWFCWGLMYAFSQALVLSWWSFFTCDLEVHLTTWSIGIFHSPWHGSPSSSRQDT